MEIHQVEGFDPSVDRSTATPRSTGAIRACSVGFITRDCASNRHHFEVHLVMADLIERLQRLGFAQLRSRVNFKGSRYLAERHPWVDYQDPVAR
jgi:hypothetical protein